MKITIYELLGMIKDEKTPKKIKYDSQEYKITKILLEDNNYYFNYINEDMECIFPINTNQLNDEVEILEEEKKIPEKLPIYDCTDAYSKFDINDNRKAINEIIDYLESKGE